MNTRSSKATSPKKLLLINISAILVILIGILVGVSLWLRAYTLHGQEVEVPQVIGLSVDEAVKTFEDLGLKVTLHDSVYVKQQKPNTIYAQAIAPGLKVKVGRVVSLTINSARPPMITLPDIADNCSSREANMRLSVLGLNVTSPEYINGEKDWVYSVKVNGQLMAPGSRIPSDARITLVVGDGSLGNQFDDLEFFDSDISDTLDHNTAPTDWEEEL